MKEIAFHSPVRNADELRRDQQLITCGKPEQPL
jgi:hypothetical protein